jgi:hypothetical protein
MRFRQGALLALSLLSLMLLGATAGMLIVTLMDLRRPVFWLYLPNSHLHVSFENQRVIVRRAMPIFEVSLWLLTGVFGCAAWALSRARRRSSRAAAGE